MAYDKCKECGHDWHGLRCGYVAENYIVTDAVIQYHECDCKTSFEQGLDALTLSMIV